MTFLDFQGQIIRGLAASASFLVEASCHVLSLATLRLPSSEEAQACHVIRYKTCGEAAIHQGYENFRQLSQVQ